MGNVPNPQAKLYGLDHLRAFAITFVLLFHYQFFGAPQWVHMIAKFGWTGVDLFFVLSGYLISSHLFAEQAATNTISLKTFFIKRSFRILTVYWVVLAVYFLVPAYREWGHLSPLWRFITFTQNFGLNLRQHSTFSHAWSLCVEEQFYLVLPIVLLILFRALAQRAGVVLLVFFFFAGFAIRLYGWHLLQPYMGTADFNVKWHELIYYPAYNRLDGLLVGIAISAFYHYRAQAALKLAGYANRLFVLGLVILAAAYWICLDESSFAATIFGFPLVAIGYGAVVFCAVSPGSFLYNRRIFATEKMAMLSYGIYLSHKGIIHLTHQFFAKHGVAEDSNLMMLLSFVFVIAAALLLNVLIEKPFLVLRNKVLKTGSLRGNK